MPDIVGSTATLEWVLPAAAVGHSVTLRVTNPDGTTTDPAVSAGATAGTFQATLDTAWPGRHLLTWTDTTDDTVHVDILDVWPADPRYLISVDDAATGLQWSAADLQKHRESLSLYVAAATEVIEDITGAVLIRTVTQTADGGRTGVALWERPSSIVSVTVDGATVTDFIPNLNAGIVYADRHGSRFADGIQNIVITYKVGSERVPPSIQLAAKELVRHLWQIGQQAAGLATGYAPNPQQMGQTRSGFAVPRRVIELCGNHYALPGIA